jgi:hypothetical protein
MTTKYRVRLSLDGEMLTSRYLDSIDEAKVLSLKFPGSTIDKFEDPTRRQWDAWLIIQGACNPSGVARTLVKAIGEAREECGDTDYVKKDLACRMICYQLADLLNVRELDNLDLFSKAMEELEGQARLQFHDTE